jgi:GT2 family glycosyltransferase
LITIITAVHNQLAMNRLFFESIKKYTFHKFELIVIDNASTDGSATYFEKEGVIVIRNTENYSYPYTQNQGIAIAKYNYIAFLNNDIIVAPNWDKTIIDSMNNNGFDALTTCGLERVENENRTKKLRLKWNLIRNAFKYLPKNYTNLKLMHKMMYYDWKKFNTTRKSKFENEFIEGCLGHSVVLTKRAIELCGEWDLRLQEADFDLYMRIKKRSIEFGDIKPCMIDLSVYNHHYIRLTAKAKYKPFADKNNLIKLNQKWSKTEMDLLLKEFVKN